MTGTIDPAQRLLAAVDLFDEQVAAMTDSDWTKPSPCDGWNGHRLLDHVNDTLTGIIGMLGGGDYRDAKQGEDGRTLTPAEGKARWRTLVARAREAADGLDPDAQLSGPMGPGPAEEALRIPNHDLTVHAWDLAATAGRPLDLPPALLADLSGLVHGMPEEIVRSPGLFGPEVPAEAGASETDQLMAFLGRQRPA